MAFVCGTKQHKLNLSDYRDESRIDTISSAEAILKSVDNCLFKNCMAQTIHILEDSLL